MDKVRIATGGRSAITERFLDALGQVPEAEYVAAYSRKEEDARAFAEGHAYSIRQNPGKHYARAIRSGGSSNGRKNGSGGSSGNASNGKKNSAGGRGGDGR